VNEVERIRVGVNGAGGRTGRAVADGLEAREDMDLVFRADRGDDLLDAIRESRARVVVDFTVPDAVHASVMTMIEAGASPVVGTTGLRPEELERIDSLLAEKGLGGIYAPNFSLGALLMMELAERISQYMDSCEIVEMHHDGKKDSPSGTALLTARRIAANPGGTGREDAPGTEADAGSRGLGEGRIRIHSVRLPGMLAHQSVIFGAPGETLTVTHDIQSRDCFIPGVCRAVREVLHIRGLRIGLEI
jgi:4-hydroxy-tetrahydrodipicolinate reductase